MATYNAGKISFEDEDKKNSSQRHTPPDNVNIVKNDTPDGSCLMNSKGDVAVDLPVDNSLGSDNTNSQCNPEAKCPQPKKNNRKRRLKDKDAPIDIHVHTSTPTDDSVGTNSCHDSLTETAAETDLKTDALPVLSKSKKRRIRKRKTLYSCVITHEVHVSLADLDLKGTDENAPISEKNNTKSRLKDEDVPIDIQVDTLMPKDDSVRTNSCHDSLTETTAKTDLKTDSVRTNSCHDSLTETTTKTDLKTDALPILSTSKKWRIRQTLNSSLMTHEVHASLADLDLTGTDENALISEKNNRKRSLQDKDVPIEIQADTLMPKDDSVGINSCHDSLTETTAKTDLKTAALPALSMSTKRMRKRQKLNSSVIVHEGFSSLADLDLTETDKNALISEKQSDSPGSPSTSRMNKHNGDPSLSLVEKENIKKKKNRRKRGRQKLDASVLSDNAYHPHEDVDVVGMEGNGLLSDKKSDPKSANVNTVEKHDAFISDGNKNIEKKKNRRKKKKQKLDTSIISVNAPHHPHAMDDVGMEGNDLLCDKQTDPTSPSVNMVGKHDNNGEGSLISDGNGNIEKNKNTRKKKQQKKLLVLDVNGLLADIVRGSHPEYKPDVVVSGKSVYKRPFCDDFLKFCFEKFNVGVWSSRKKHNLKNILKFVMEDSRHKLLFCWNQSHCTRTGCKAARNSTKPLFLKELKKLWDKAKIGLPWKKGQFNESNTLLLDDSPSKALRNPANTAIFPQPYSYMDATDSSLGPTGDLRQYLEKLAEAKNVQEYIAQNPFGQKAITESTACSFFQEVFRRISRNESKKSPCVKIASSS